MRKIEFGFNDDNNLNATWGGIEFYNGEYLDVVNCNDMDFLITRIVDSNEALGIEGNIDVREIAQDYYSDGSYMTYGNKEKNSLCKKIEQYLNTTKVKEQLEKERPMEVLRDAGFPAYSSRLLPVYSKYEEFAEVLTSVKPEVFKRLVDSKKEGYGMSMFNLTEEVNKLRSELEKLQGKGMKR